MAIDKTAEQISNDAWSGLASKLLPEDTKLLGIMTQGGQVDEETLASASPEMQQRAADITGAQSEMQSAMDKLKEVTGGFKTEAERVEKQKLVENITSGLIKAIAGAVAQNQGWTANVNIEGSDFKSLLEGRLRAVAEEQEVAKLGVAEKQRIVQEKLKAASMEHVWRNKTAAQKAEFLGKAMLENIQLERKGEQAIALERSKQTGKSSLESQKQGYKVNNAMVANQYKLQQIAERARVEAAKQLATSEGKDITKQFAASKQMLSEINAFDRTVTQKLNKPLREQTIASKANEFGVEEDVKAGVIKELMQDKLNVFNNQIKQQKSALSDSTIDATIKSDVKSIVSSGLLPVAGGKKPIITDSLIGKSQFADVYRKLVNSDNDEVQKAFVAATGGLSVQELMKSADINQLNQILANAELQSAIHNDILSNASTKATVGDRVVRVPDMVKLGERYPWAKVKYRD
jgi:hypothetical protein